jgi:DNA transformation protein
MPSRALAPPPHTARHELADFCAELLSPLGPVRVRRMFGGHGFYVDDLFIALIFEQQFFLQTDASIQPQFEAAGGRPFRYEGHGRVVQMSYWTPPEEAMESPDAMLPWARLAMAAALKALNAAAAKKKRAPAAKASKASKSSPAPALKPASPAGKAPKPAAEPATRAASKRAPKRSPG